MKEIQSQIAHEALEMMAQHYKTTKSKVAEAIYSGNEKLIKEYTSLCKKTLEMVSA